MSIPRYYDYELPVIWLDIRSRKEYCHAHLPNAILIETNAVPQTVPELVELRNKLNRVTRHLPKNTRLFVYCKLGLRANEARQILMQDLGFTNVTNMGGVQTEPIKSYMMVKGMVERC